MPKWKYLVIIPLVLAICVFVDKLCNMLCGNKASVDNHLKKETNLFVSENAIYKIERNLIEKSETIPDGLVSGKASFKNTNKPTSESESEENKNDKIPNVYDMIQRIHQTIRIAEPSVQPLVFSCNETSIDGTEDLLCMVCFCFPSWERLRKEIRPNLHVT